MVVSGAWRPPARWRRGYDVILFEKSAWLGGKAAELHVEGYRFDMGPTILLMPSVLKKIFAEAGRDLGDELEMVALDPQWRSFFADGSTLDLHASTMQMAETLDQFAPGSASGEGYERFLDLSRRLDDISHRYFFWRSIGGLKDMFDPKTAVSPATLGDVMAMRPWGTVGGTIRSYVGDRRVAQMLDHFTQYVGSSPDRSPAVLCGIAHMQTSEGIWYPRRHPRGRARPRSPGPGSGSGIANRRGYPVDQARCVRRCGRRSHGRQHPRAAGRSRLQCRRGAHSPRTAER